MSTEDDWFAERREMTRANAAESILKDLQEGIRSKKLGIGDKLPSEVKLAHYYDVSRPVVREALRSAQALGLTHTRTGSGTYIVAETPRIPQSFGDYSTHDLMESRAAIEIPSARLAAIRRSSAQAGELLDLCRQMDEEFRPRAWVQLDSLFHVKIAEASGNAVFASVVSNTRDALTQQSEIINLIAHRREPSNVEHREIAEAIAEQSPDRAASAMKAHLSYVEAVVRPMLEEDSSGL